LDTDESGLKPRDHEEGEAVHDVHQAKLLVVHRNKPRMDVVEDGLLVGDSLSRFCLHYFIETRPILKQPSERARRHVGAPAP
jgi:hypothetical protein